MYDNTNTTSTFWGTLKLNESNENDKLSAIVKTEIKDKMWILIIWLYSDIDECANDTENNCHENALCKNNNGSYSCNCTNGYIGDGHNCTGKIILQVELTKEYKFP